MRQGDWPKSAESDVLAAVVRQLQSNGNNQFESAGRKVRDNLGAAFGTTVARANQAPLSRLALAWAIDYNSRQNLRQRLSRFNGLAKFVGWDGVPPLPPQSLHSVRARPRKLNWVGVE